MALIQSVLSARKSNLLHALSSFENKRACGSKLVLVCACMKLRYVPRVLPFSVFPNSYHFTPLLSSRRLTFRYAKQLSSLIGPLMQRNRRWSWLTFDSSHENPLTFLKCRNFPYVHEFCAKRFSHFSILNTPSNMLPVSSQMNFVTFEQSTRKLDPNNSYAVWIGHTCVWGLANERPRSQIASNAPCKRRKYELCTHRRVSSNIPLHRALRRSGWSCWGTSFVVPNASEMRSLHHCYVVQMHCNDR